MPTTSDSLATARPSTEPTVELPDGSTRTTVAYGDFQRRLLDGPSRQELVDDEGFARALFEHLDGVLPSTATTISVDVFDTLLLRRPIAELTRFLAIAERQAAALAEDDHLDGPVAPLDLLVARLQATHASYGLSQPRAGEREGSLSQIYRTVERTLSLRRSGHRLLIEQELAYEVLATYPNGPLCRWLEAKRSEGLELVLLSDMYLHDEHIRHLLDAHDVLPATAVVSSADHKVTKHSGSAYPALLQARGLRPEQLFHLGDNLRSDYQLARNAGIASAHLPIPSSELETIRQSRFETLTRLQDLGHDVSRWI